MLLQPLGKCGHYSQACRTHRSTEPSYDPPSTTILRLYFLHSLPTYSPLDQWLLYILYSK